MIAALRFVFIGVLVAMLAVTMFASNQMALWDAPRSFWSHPWLIATLFDTYFAFLTFWLWVAYKEHSIAARVLWLIAILLLGNFAMATYMLIELFKLPKDATLDRLFLRHRLPANS